MSELHGLVRDLRDRGHRLTVYSRGDDRVANDFPNRNVEVVSRTLPPDGPEPFVVVETDGEFAAVVSLADLERLVEPPIRRPTPGDGVSDGYRVLFDALDDTVFTSLRRHELLAVSREIEERAYRVGTGTLHAAFQRTAAFRRQERVYRALAADTDLEIHVYAAGDEHLPSIPGLSVHPIEDEWLERYWVVAFDGGGDESQACGLVAQETADGYTGFWTDNPETVARITAALTG